MITLEKTKLTRYNNPILQGEMIRKVLQDHKGNARPLFDHALRFAISNFQKRLWRYEWAIADLMDIDCLDAIHTVKNCLRILEKSFPNISNIDYTILATDSTISDILCLISANNDMVCVPESWRHVSMTQKSHIKPVKTYYLNASVYKRDKKSDNMFEMSYIDTRRISYYTTLFETRNFREELLHHDNTSHLVTMRYSFQYNNPVVHTIQLVVFLLDSIIECVHRFDCIGEEYCVYREKEYEEFSKVQECLESSDSTTIQIGLYPEWMDEHYFI